MTIRLLSSIVTLAAVAVWFALASIPAMGQSTAIPRLPDGKPDFNGVWDHPRVGDVTKSGTGCGNGAVGCKQEGSGELAFTPAGLAKWNDPARYDYTARCLPYGYMRGWGSSAPIQIMQTPSRLAFLFEIGSTYQVVFTDESQYSRFQRLSISLLLSCCCLLHNNVVSLYLKRQSSATL